MLLYATSLILRNEDGDTWDATLLAAFWALRYPTVPAAPSAWPRHRSPCYRRRAESCRGPFCDKKTRDECNIRVQCYILHHSCIAAMHGKGIENPPGRSGPGGPPWWG